MTVQLAYAASQLGNAAEALGTYEVHLSTTSACLGSQQKHSSNRHSPCLHETNCTCRA